MRQKVMTLSNYGIGAGLGPWVLIAPKTKKGFKRIAMVRLSSVSAVAEPPTFDSESISAPHRAKHLVFVDQASLGLLDLLDRIAPSDAAVLIAGESGTGKELVARYIHRKSGRTGPFLALNCSAISEHLAESELFGHESGAFTGANSRREGWFEAANGGTLFLDEISNVSLALQSKLLRVLQEHEVTRVGSRKSTPVDVRIISAANVDLAAGVAAGTFRLDLFYRLNIVSIRLPALRERPGDIQALADHFIGVYSTRLKRPPPTLTPGALEALERYAWPGNIRELENVIHFSLLTATEREIQPAHLRLPASGGTVMPSPSIVDRHQSQALDGLRQALQGCFATPGNNLFRDIERRLVEDAFCHCNENQVRTAELLGISRNVVRTLLKRYGLLSEAEASLADSIDAEALRHPEKFDLCRNIAH
jgi:DNA-binding NtrC family response regulator